MYESSTVLSDAKEIELGKIADEYVRHQFYIEKNPELNTSVNNIAQKLFVYQTGKQFHLHVMSFSPFQLMHFPLPVALYI